MTDEVDALNRGLRRSGQSVTLRKVTGTTSQTYTDVICPAVVRGYSPQELVGDITQQDSFVIISPTQIIAAVWPSVQGAGADVRIPSKNRGDLCMIAGVWRAVQAGVGIYLPGNRLVRIEFRVR